MVRRLAALLALGSLAFVGTACGSSSKSSSSNTTVASKTPLNVFAAASLTSAFNKTGDALASSGSDLDPTFNFAGSQQLVQQIQQGADADVFASADPKNMKKLEDAGLVQPPKTFAHNKLQIAVAPGNPKNVKTLADLEKPGVVLVLADKSVPAGNYALQAFEKAGLPAPEPKSVELDVKSTLAKLKSGEADAVIVYTTDVTAAGDKVDGVAIPDRENVEATYPIAVVKTSKHPTEAAAFVDQIVSGTGQEELKAAGFLPPS